MIWPFDKAALRGCLPSGIHMRETSNGGFSNNYSIVWLFYWAFYCPFKKASQTKSVLILADLASIK